MLRIFVASVALVAVTIGLLLHAIHHGMQILGRIAAFGPK
jgi:hypothetical protein